MKYPVQNQNGMTLVEILVALGIFLLTVSAVGSQLIGFNKEMVSLQAKKEMGDIESEIQRLMGVELNCTATLRGLAVNEATPVNIDGLFTGIQNTPVDIPRRSPSASFINGQQFGKATVNDIELAILQKVRNLPTIHYLAQINYSVSSQNKINSFLKSAIPIIVQMNTNGTTIDNCFVASNGGSSLEEKECEFRGELLKYDPVTGQCIERPVEIQYFEGDQHYATCGAGYKVYPDAAFRGVCTYTAPPGFTDSQTYQTARNYGNQTIAIGPDFMLSWIDRGANRCVCNFDFNDIPNPTDFACRVKCFK